MVNLIGASPAAKILRSYLGARVCKEDGGGAPLGSTICFYPVGGYRQNPHVYCWSKDDQSRSFLPLTHSVKRFIISQPVLEGLNRNLGDMRLWFSDNERTR